MNDDQLISYSNNGVVSYARFVCQWISNENANTLLTPLNVYIYIYIVYWKLYAIVTCSTYLSYSLSPTNCDKSRIWFTPCGEFVHVLNMYVRWLRRPANHFHLVSRKVLLYSTLRWDIYLFSLYCIYRVRKQFNKRLAMHDFLLNHKLDDLRGVVFIYGVCLV